MENFLGNLNSNANKSGAQGANLSNGSSITYDEARKRKAEGNYFGGVINSPTGNTFNAGATLDRAAQARLTMARSGLPAGLSMSSSAHASGGFGGRFSSFQPNMGTSLGTDHMNMNKNLNMNMGAMNDYAMLLGGNNSQPRMFYSGTAASAAGIPSQLASASAPGSLIGSSTRTSNQASLLSASASAGVPHHLVAAAASAGPPAAFLGSNYDANFGMSSLLNQQTQLSDIIFDNLNDQNQQQELAAMMSRNNHQLNQSDPMTGGFPAAASDLAMSRYRASLLGPPSLPRNMMNPDSLHRQLIQANGIPLGFKQSLNDPSQTQMHATAAEDLPEDGRPQAKRQRKKEKVVYNKYLEYLDHVKTSNPPSPSASDEQEDAVAVENSYMTQFMSSQQALNNNEQTVEEPFGSPFPMGIVEDINWLSEVQCYLRSDMIEVFQAETPGGGGRGRRSPSTNNHNDNANEDCPVMHVGIRCRWCHHLPPAARVCRSAAFPSSLRQLYQSFTMMVRDHFGGQTMCTAIPVPVKEKLIHLRKTKSSQGASDSKHYWIHAAKKLGMMDTKDGIQITPASRAAGRRMLPYGAPMAPCGTKIKPPPPVELLVEPSDINKASNFLYALLLECQVVYLEQSELVAKRKTLPVGLKGIGCRYCCAVGRFGFSRRFPLRKRCLPEELKELLCHMLRCPLCPDETKHLLRNLHARHESAIESGEAFLQAGSLTKKDGRVKDPHREFFDLLWQRLGRKGDIKT